MKQKYLGAALALAFVATGFSQTTSTTILGTVTDPSGAAVAGAKVTATNIRTQVKREDVTTNTGDYSFPLIDIGEYSVSVEASGFKTAARTGLILQINEKLRSDFTLQVGQVSERVEVTGAVTALKTDESSIGDVIEQKRIVELPVNGRNVGNLAVLQAGVMFGSRGGLDGQSGGGGGIPIPGQTIAIVANGQREVSQHATLDGVVATEARVNTVPFSPSPEAIEEVKVFTGTYSAEYGFNSGAQLIMVMRSGTNDLHGSLFEFLRNDKFDAEDYFQNYFNTSSARLPKQGVRQNQFGFVLNGPVVLPKLYNGKDKTFFMFNYEGRRRSLPGAASSSLVPTEEFRNGDFSQLLRIPTPVQLIDPISGVPFAGNIIPQSRISSTAKSIIPFWEKPQVSVANPLVGFNYTGTGPNRITDNQYFVKGDHNFSTKDKVMGRYATNSVDWLTYSGFSPQFSYLVLGRNDNIATQWIHVFSPAAVLETRYGFTRSKDDSFNPRANTDFNLAALGMDGFRVVNDGNRPLTKREAGLPSMNVAGLQGLAERDGGNGFDDNKLHQISSSLNLSFGRHNVKVGGEYRHITLFRGAANVPRGAFSFNGDISGNSFAQFLLGLPSTTDTPEGLPLTDVLQHRTGFYVNDDWKVSRKLTVNIGVRYEYNSMARDVRGLWRSAEIKNGTYTYVPGDIRTQYDFYTPQKDMFMPRIGLAYRASDAWVIRAGYGIYYNVHQLNNYTILNLNPPLSGSANFVNGASNFRLVNTTNPLTFANPFGVINRSSPVSANVLNKDNFQPMVNQWSFDIQRRLPWDMALNVGYVGSGTAHLDNTVEANSPDPAFNTATSSVQSRRPYQFINDNGVLRPLTRVRFLDSGANASYHGLQTTLQKRFAKGLSFSIAHTWSKTLMEGYGRNESDGYNPNAYQNPRNRAADKGRVGFDVTHNVVSNFVYELPFFAGSTNAFVKNVLGGWQTNGVITMRTGFPMTVTQGNIINTSAGAPRPDRIGLGSLSNPTVNQWFNPNDFRLVSCQNTATPELCRYGNSGMAVLEGPGAKIVDFSLFKNFQIHERVKLQFRSEMYNLFNTPQFARPNGSLNTAAAFLPTRGANGTLNFPSQANQVRGPGAITSLVSPMRQIQFGLKLLW